jgi:hypothetical protein
MGMGCKKWIYSIVYFACSFIHLEILDGKPATIVGTAFTCNS